MAAASLVVRISAQIAEFQKAFADTSRTINKFSKDFEGVATRASIVGNVIGNALSKVASTAVSALSNTFKDAIKLSSQFHNAFIGLSSVARAFGTDAGVAQQAARSLASDGLMPVADAATGLKNLLAAGFSLPQATKLMEAFKDSAAFGRQGALSFGEAIRGATEGVKNSNPVLVDNAGITKNLSQILKEAGFSAQDLSRAQSDASVRMALYNGILKEANAFTGDAARLTETYSGQVARLESQYDIFLGTLGDVVTQNATVAKLIERIGDVFGALTARLIDNKKGFDLVSSAVIITVKGIADLVHVIDLAQTAFRAFQVIANETFSAIAKGLSFLLKGAEKGLQIQAFLDPFANLDPVQGQRMADIIRSVREEYTFLDGAVKGFAEASDASIGSSIKLGNTLQDVRTRATSLAAELETTRGKTIEVGGSTNKLSGSVQDLIDSLGGGAGKSDTFAKSLDKLTKQIDSAFAAGTPLAKIIEIFGPAADKAAEKADAMGRAIKESLRTVAEGFRDLEVTKFLDKELAEANRDIRRLAADIENEWKQAGERASREYWENFDKNNDKFSADLLQLQKDLVATEEDSLEKRLKLIRLEFEGKRREVNQFDTFYREKIAALTAAEAAERVKATEAWQTHIEEVKAKAAELGDSWKGVLSRIPEHIAAGFKSGGLAKGFKHAFESLKADLAKNMQPIFADLANQMSETFANTFGAGVASLLGTVISGIGAALGAAITGGKEAFKASLASLFSVIGSDIGEEAFTKLAKKLSGTFAKVFGDNVGKALETILPAIGGALGSLLAPLLGKAFDALKGLFDRDKGRDLIEDFAASHGGFDALQKKLADTFPAEEAHKFWVMLTQGVGRNNPEQARAAIEAVTAAFERQAKATKDAETAAGDLQKKQEEAADAVSQKFKDRIAEIDSEMKSLQEAIAQEAPEKVMGVIEQQQRARVDALEREREEVVRQWEEAMKEVKEIILREFRTLDIPPIEVPVDLDLPDNPTIKVGVELPDSVEELFPNLERLQHGGIVRKPTLALIGEAGPEAVVPLSQTGTSFPRPSGGGNVIVRSVVIQSQTDDPEELNRQFWKAVRRGGKTRDLAMEALGLR